MMRDHVNRALLISAGLLLVVGAAAQPQSGAAGRDHAAPQAGSPGGGNGHGDGHGNGDGHGSGHGNGPNVINAPGTPGAKGDGPKQGGASDQENVSDRGARMKAEHESERAKLMAALHAPMDEGAKQELKKHAMRVAYLERIKTLATAAKDQDAIDRATKLLDKEKARHEKWLANLTATAPTTPPATPNGGAR